MLLGRKSHTAGDTIRYIVDYSDYLEPGVTLTAATVVLDPAFTATVTDITISGVGVLDPNHVVFLMAGGSVNENFTLDISVTDSRSEVKNDTLGYTIVLR